MNMGQVKRLQKGDCVFCCTSKKRLLSGHRPGYIGFVVETKPSGRVFVDAQGERKWWSHRDLFPENLHYRDHHLVPEWARPYHDIV